MFKPNQMFTKWIVGGIIFLLLEAGFIGAEDQESLRGILEMLVTGLIWILLTVFTALDYLHRKHPQADGKPSPFAEWIEKIKAKLFVVEK